MFETFDLSGVIENLQNLLTVAACFCMAIWLLVNRGRHTLGVRWFALAALCLAGVLALSLSASWHTGTFVLTCILGGIGALGFYVPEKTNPYAPARVTPWQFWRQPQWERDYTTPARPYKDGQPELPWAIRHQRALARGETPPPAPWEGKQS